MIRRSDVTVSKVVDGLGIPEAGVYITVRNADGDIATLFDDDGSLLDNPLVSGADGAFHYNIADEDQGTYFEEYRLSPLATARKVWAIGLGTDISAAVLAVQDEIETDAAQIAQYVGDAVQQIAAATDLFAAVNAAPASGLSISAVNRTALAGLAVDRPAVLMEDGLQGSFVPVLASAWTAAIAADTLNRDFVMSTVDVTKVWGRVSALLGEPIYAKREGAKGDGTANDTSAVQAGFSLVTTSAISKSLAFGTGNYRANATILQGKGMTIRGDGRTSSIITSIAGSNASALGLNGCWYSLFSGLSFRTENGLTTKGVVEQDGNYDGTHTMGTQGITWQQCDFDARGTADGVHSKAAFYMNRQGGSSGQGSECLFLNDHFYGGTEACYYQGGFNALNNIFLGGNFQSYPKNAIKLDTGSAHVIGTGFQSTQGYTQILNGGYDINMSSGGVREGILIYGCRTESLRFFKGGNAQRYDVRGNNQSSFSSQWQANHAYALNDVTYETTASGLNNLYVVTTAGTSGASKPTFPDTGTVADGAGSLVWTQTPIDVIVSELGEYNPRTNSFWFSNSVNMPRSGNRIGQYVAGPATYLVQDDDEVIEANATSGSITINISSLVGRYAFGGKRLTIYRPDTNFSNAVTVGSMAVLPGGSITYQCIPGHLNAWTFHVDSYRGPTSAITVAQLPAANAVPLGTRIIVSDANSTTFNAAAVGSSTNKVSVYSDGSAWKVG